LYLTPPKRLKTTTKPKEKLSNREVRETGRVIRDSLAHERN